ncbi:MAG: Rpp14/Pop5 family protein [Methanobacteriaceae archaeon]|jgi:ribonuclease P/MRP protein subunit POP5|nr:Rpp14/Pop5 family protein [Methanobacteriaceae archaeon]MDO9626720.1 Rpp14/Pop5 family protein [Methanobacteriaceae archaeon]MDP2836088.1 Rpp14/Pop5 family protein [Methanobacteriaceae archaeon]MDP3622354.1 Rpp14/Pop5 family protein [Methanobacteriaceae archaeon]
MKLKILPPTLRGSKRYIAFELICQKSITRDELVNLIWNSCLELYGESETSRFRLWLMRKWDCGQKGNDFIIKGILHCNRGDEEKVRASLSLVTNFRGKKVVFHTLGLSGTIHSATQKFIKSRP